MTDQPSITCRELIDFIADYLDCSLPPTQVQVFEKHLHDCPCCVAYLESYKTTVKLGKTALTASDAPASGEVPEALIKAIRAARQAKQN